MDVRVHLTRASLRFNSPLGGFEGGIDYFHMVPNLIYRSRLERAVVSEGDMVTGGMHSVLEYAEGELVWVELG